MAEKVELVQLPESLVCSLCLEPFGTPTLLSCGHTFCKVCLELYDKKNQDQKFMECPLCMEHTQLGENRISGLPPNFSVKGIEEELNVNLKVNGKSSEYCSLHSQVYKDILCEVCKEFICLTCLLEKHPGHGVKKKEVVVAELNKKRISSLIKRSDKKKARIEASIKSGKQHKLDMHSHLDNLDREIENSFLEKSAILQVHRERLTKEVDDIRKQSGKEMTDLIGRQKHSLQLISKNIILKSGLVVQEGVASTSTCKFRDSDALKTRYMEVLVLKKELDRDLKDLSTADALQEVEDTRFRPSDENDLDLGTLDQEASESESENDSDQGSVDQDASESEDVLDENVLDN